MNYQKKYLKYKSRYLALKGGLSKKLVPDSEYEIMSFLDFKQLGIFIQTNKENLQLKTNDKKIQLKEIIVSSRNVLAGILSFEDISNNLNYKFIIDNLVIKVRN